MRVWQHRGAAAFQLFFHSRHIHNLYMIINQLKGAIIGISLTCVGGMAIGQEATLIEYVVATPKAEEPDEALVHAGDVILNTLETISVYLRDVHDKQSADEAALNLLADVMLFQAMNTAQIVQRAKNTLYLNALLSSKAEGFINSAEKEFERIAEQKYFNSTLMAYTLKYLHAPHTSQLDWSDFSAAKDTATAQMIEAAADTPIAEILSMATDRAGADAAAKRLMMRRAAEMLKTLTPPEEYVDIALTSNDKELIAKLHAAQYFGSLTLQAALDFLKLNANLADLRADSQNSIEAIAAQTMDLLREIIGDDRASDIDELVQMSINDADIAWKQAIALREWFMHRLDLSAAQQERMRILTIAWLKYAAKQGCPYAQIDMCTESFDMVCEGEELKTGAVDELCAEAFRTLDARPDKKTLDALYLSICYLNGLGVKEDMQKAVEWNEYAMQNMPESLRMQTRKDFENMVRKKESSR